MRVPFGARTVTRVSFVRLPTNLPATRITGNGRMNSSVLCATGGGSEPAGV